MNKDIFLPSGWRFERIGDLVESVSVGHVGSTSKYFVEEGKGIRLIRSQNIRPGRLVLEDTAWITSEFHNSHPKSIMRAGDILITRVGANAGDCCVVPKNIPDLHLSSAVYIRPFYESEIGKFLGIYFRSSSGQRLLKTRIVGSVSERINSKDVEELLIPVPPTIEATKIHSFISSLDEKIEINKKNNETLENFGRSLFKSWFIDFDPVRAKAEGRSTGLPNEISDLFPNSFEESELGEIPRGWVICNIDELLDLEKKSINPIESPEEIFDHYSIPAFDDGQNPTQDIGFSIKSNKFLIPENTFLVCKLNPRFLRVWLPSKESSRRRISSTEFLVCKYKKNIGLPYAYYLTKSFRVTEAMRYMATGTSSSHQRLRPKDFTSILTIRPNSKLLDCFTETLFPFLEKSLMIRDQNILLTRYRDTVLPKLISGELRIPDTEKLIEEVGI